MAAFTIDQVILNSRELTGNKESAVQGDEFVSDAAIIAGLAEPVRECCEAFGASSSKKETQFWTTTGPVLSAPDTLTVTPDTSAGTLSAGTYGYRVSATTSGGGETVPGGETTATLAGTGQMNLSWSAVTGAAGYNIYGRTPSGENFLKNVPATQTTWTDTGVIFPAGGIPAYSSAGGSTGRWLQDYDIATYIGTDVLEITDVMRSDAYVSDSTLQPLVVDPRTGIPYARAAFIDQAYQQDALEIMVAQARWQKIQDFNSWMIVNNTGSPALRLMPTPIQQAIVVVQYVSTADTIDSLPADAQIALNYAAAYTILDCALTRYNTVPSAMRDPESQRWTADWLKMLERQRDRYESKYRQALEKRPRM